MTTDRPGTGEQHERVAAIDEPADPIRQYSRRGSGLAEFLVEVM